MNQKKADYNKKIINDEQADIMFSSWSEDDFEELQDETPWEIFAWEVNNWASLNCSSGI